MKHKISVLLVLFLILSLSLASAQAATVVQRLEILETAIGLPLPGELLIDRICCLEKQLGVTPAADATIESRIAALEAVLGFGASYPLFDNSVYSDTTPLTSLGYFSKTDRVIEAEAGNYYDTSNYGCQYATLVYCDSTKGSIEYRLDEPYKAFMFDLYVTAPAAMEGHDHYWNTASISVYADEELIYTTTGFQPKADPLPIQLNVHGAQFIKIEFADACYYNNGRECPLIAIGDPTLMK